MPPSDWSPHAYQERAIELMLAEPAAALLLDPGLGKTSIVLAAIKAMRDAGGDHRTLVIAPLRVCYSVWPEEASKWRQFQDLKVAVLHGPKKTKALEEDADIYVINPEGLQWLSSQRWASMPPNLVVDESTKFKATRTQRFKLLRSMLPKFRRRYILTGTPAPNGLLDLFGQFYLLDGGERLGRYITHYRTTYFWQTGFGGYTWVPKPGAMGRIHAAISDVTLRLASEDHLKLPGRIVRDVHVELPKKAQGLYKRFKVDFVTHLEEGTVTAANAAVLANKLRQVANGCLYLEDQPGKHAQLHTAKLDALVDLVDELSGQPLLVGYEFKSDRDEIAHAFDAPVIGGGTSAKEGAELVEAWNSGELEVLLCHPASAGHGLNLAMGGHHLCFYGLGWNLESYEQFIRRLDRHGQTDPVLVHRLLAKDTVDLTIARVLEGKDSTQRSLLSALKKDMG